MPSTTQSAASVRSYLITFIGVLAAFAIRYSLGPLIGGSIPVVMFTVPIAAAAIYGGFGPGMFATILGCIISTYFFVPPYYSLAITDLSSAVVAASFLATGTLISLLGRRMYFLKSRTEKQTQALQEENKRKDEYLAMLAHELRNPLAGISTAAELLKFVRLDEHRLNTTGEVITRQVQHMTKLIDDLLDVSRLTRGLVILEKKPVDMADVVHGAMEQTQALFNKMGHRLTVHLPSEPAWTCGDYTRLVQAVANLLENAAKYTPAGGHVDLAVDDGKEIEVRVQDNGQGMAPELLPLVFNPFVQAERKVDRSQGGLGLGLALVQKITDLHDGTVAAHSQGPGYGSTFTVRLPRWHQSAVVDKLPGATGVVYPEEEHAASARPLTVMVVDDNRDAALGLASLLERQGHTVLVAHTSKLALDLAHTEEVDAFLLDIGLPDVDGYELARLLSRIPHASTAAFIAVTGDGTKEDKERAQEAGFQHHFVKPVNTANLVAVLNRIAAIR